MIRTTTAIISIMVVIAGLHLTGRAEASSTKPRTSTTKSEVKLSPAEQCDFYEGYKCYMRLDIEYNKADRCLSIGYRGRPFVVLTIWVHGTSGFPFTKDIRQKGGGGPPYLVNFGPNNKLCACRKYPGFHYDENCSSDDVFIPGSYDIMISLAPNKTKGTLPQSQDYIMGGASFDLTPDGTVLHRK